VAGGFRRLQSQVINKAWECRRRRRQGARDWDISRDPTTSAIRIPGIKQEKYFYVWLTRRSATSQHEDYCEKKGRIIRRLRKPDRGTEMIHFIGKDIIYFHTLFLARDARISGYKTPDQVNVHGFITVSGDKMSKSRGTGIDPLRYLDLG